MEAKAWASARVVVQAAGEAHRRHLDLGLAGKSDRRNRGASREKERASGCFPTQMPTSISGSTRRRISPRSSLRTAADSTLRSPTPRATSSSPTRTGGRPRGARHLAVGQVEYDNSAAAWSIDILVRIDDPGTGSAGRRHEGGAGGVAGTGDCGRGRECSIQDGGRVVVDGEGRSPHRGDPVGSLAGPDHEPKCQRAARHGRRIGSRRRPSSPMRPGSWRTRSWITGFAHSGGRATYAAVDQAVQRLRLDHPPAAAGVHDPEPARQALRAIENAFRTTRACSSRSGLPPWRSWSSSFRSSMPWYIARRFRTGHSSAVRDMAERAARGEAGSPAGNRRIRRRWCT